MLGTGTWAGFGVERRSGLTSSVFAVMLTALSLPALAVDQAPPATQSLETVLQAAGDQRGRFILASGKTVIGRIAKTDGVTLWIRRPSGGLMALSLADIAAVRIRATGGEMVEGRLSQMVDGGLGWRPVDTDGHDVEITPAIAEAYAEKETDAGGPLVRVDDGLLRRDLTQLADQSPAEALPTAADRPANAPDDAGSPPRLTISADRAQESDGEVRFRLALSKPAQGSILIIYSMVDGSAKAPGDYSHGQGVVVFEPGQKETVITTRIVDDAVAEGDETLFLFITADPSAVLIEERKVAATISDSD
jgi:hypothetical protein